MRSAGGAPVNPLTGGGTITGSIRTSPSYQMPGFDYTQGVAKPSKGLTDLTNYINNLQRTAQTLANQARIPQAAGLEEQSSANIAAGMKGIVNPDVLRQLQVQAAERGISMGPESPATNAAYLQALGLTSYGLQEQAQRDLSAAYARNPAAPLFDPTTQLLTPSQAGSLALEQQRLQQQAYLEQERLDLERERMRMAGAGGGGGYYAGSPRGTTTQTYGGGVDPTTRTYGGATGDILSGSIAPEFSRSDWWASIGYGAGAPTTTGPGTFYAGPSYGGLTEDELYQGYGLTGEDWTNLGLTSLEDLYSGGGGG